MHRDFYYLVKSTGRVHLYFHSGGHDQFLSTVPVEEVARGPWIILTKHTENQGLVMMVPTTESHPPCFWSNDEGRTFRPVAAPPGASKPWARATRVLSNGWVLFVDGVGSTLWLSRLIGEDWTPYPLPEDFVAWDASLGEGGIIYLAGEISDSEEGGGCQRGIIAALGNGGFELFSLPFAARDRRRLRNHGGDQSFERIDATEHPIVVTSDCYSFLDSLFLSDFASEMFVLTEDWPNWSLLRLNAQGLHIVREPQRSTAIYTYDGRRFVKPLLGGGWQEDKIVFAAETWARSQLNTKPVLTSVSVQEDALIMGLTLHSGDSMDAPSLGCYILHSDDRGKSFHMLMRKSGDVEVCGILSAD